MIIVTNPTTGQKSTLIRDVCTIHPKWVHAQLGTTDECELQVLLDGFHIEMWYQGDRHLGPDVNGLEMFRDPPSNGFNAYTVQLSNEPSYYGSPCSQKDADRIVTSLSNLIKSKFPGIEIELWRDGQKSSATTGPDVEIIAEINRWIADNWTAAL